MKGFRRRQAERSVEAWDEDKRGAQRFVESQPKELRVQLLAVVDELAALGETRSRRRHGSASCSRLWTGS
jgi:hypothetical protein